MNRLDLASGLAFIITWMPATGMATQLPNSIHFFVEHHVSIQHPSIDIRVHNVRGLGSTDRILSRNLANEESIARQQAELRINENFVTIRQALQHEVEIYLLIERFGIERFPAAIVDEKFLIYGGITINEVVTAWRSALR